MAREDAIRRMATALEEARPRLQFWDACYRAQEPRPFVSEAVRTAVADRLPEVIVGWPGLIVRSRAERLNVEGFRLAPDTPADEQLWQDWQRNNMDEASQQGHLEALVQGRAFVVVWADDEGEPRISVESARQMTAEYPPGTRALVRALKLWTEDGYGRAVLYEGDTITRWRSQGRVPDAGDTSYVPATGWQLVETIGNPFGRPPVVVFVNHDRLLDPCGEAEFNGVLGFCRAVNTLSTNALVNPAAAARRYPSQRRDEEWHRRRAATTRRQRPLRAPRSDEHRQRVVRHRRTSRTHRAQMCAQLRTSTQSKRM